MSTRSFAAFLNEVKSDETFARDLKRALASVNKNEIPGVVAELAHKRGMQVDIESLQTSMNIASAPEFSDSEIEYNCTAWTLIAVSRGCSLRITCQPCTIACLQ